MESYENLKKQYDGIVAKQTKEQHDQWAKQVLPLTQKQWINEKKELQAKLVRAEYIAAKNEETYTEALAAVVNGELDKKLVESVKENAVLRQNVVDLMCKIEEERNEFDTALHEGYEEAYDMLLEERKRFDEAEKAFKAELKACEEIGEKGYAQAYEIINDLQKRYKELEETKLNNQAIAVKKPKK